MSLKNNSKLKIVFFGNHIYGCCSLNALVSSGFYPSLVITNVPREDENIWYPSVSDLAIHHSIKVIKCNKVIDGGDIVKTIREIAPDILVISSYRNILGDHVLDLAKLGAINLHMAPLPKYRGAHPENWALINGENQMGYTVHYLDEGIDTGDIIAQDSVSILDEDDILSLTFKLASVAPKLLIKVLEDMQLGIINRVSQDESQATYYRPRKPSDGYIDWSSIDTDIYNLVKGLTRPYPGAFTYLQGAKFIVWRTRLSPDGTDESAPGTIISSTSAGVLVSTGGNAILITDYQWSGGKISKEFNGEIFE
jgi:methionyl-tRNA formyltransferase